MGLEDLLAIRAAAVAEAEDDTDDDTQPTEAMTCTLTSGSRVVFDVPNTRR